MQEVNEYICLWYSIRVSIERREFMNIDFIKKHPEWFTILGLCIIFYFIFFHGIGTYALMDSDETRYVSMARDMFNSGDYLTLRLNGAYFFEKPPLYFWLECTSFGLFGKVNEFTARFPVSMCGMISSFLAYFIGKKIVSRKYGIISALILATSLEFVILSKFAILDIVVSACVLFSLYSGIMTYFCKEQNKKYFWWLFYLFSGCAVMAKGIPGFIVPFGTMFFIAIATKRFKELFKPVYMLPGIILFLAVSVPWHVIMIKIHDPLFFNEYIIKHHLHRFLNSQDLGRHEPWYFFILVFLWGFIPWTYSMIAAAVCKFNYLKWDKLKEFSYEKLDKEHQFLFMNGIAFLFIMFFFSSSSTKLITYFLPIYMPAAFLLAHVWKDYIEKDECRKAINISIYIWGGICLTASFIAIFTAMFLPHELNEIIETVKWFSIILLAIFGVWSILSAHYNKKWMAFASYVLLIAVLSAFGTKSLFKIDYKFGQDDLMRFAKTAKQNNNELMTFGFTEKYNLLYYYGDYVIYNETFDYPLLEAELEKPNTVIILKNKQMREILKNIHYDDFEVIDTGVKYSLVRGERN